MSQNTRGPLRPLRELDPSSPGVEGLAGRHLRNVEAPAELSPAAMDVGRKLLESAGPSGGGGWFGHGSRWVTGGTVVAAAVALVATVQLSRAGRGLRPEQTPPPPPVMRALEPAPPPPELYAPSEESLPPPARSPVTSKARPSRRRVAPLPPEVQPPAAAAESGTEILPWQPSLPSAPSPTGDAVSSAPSSLSTEAELIGSALRALRQERDGFKAVRLLDTYRLEFPQGQLATEAEMARVDALLALGRSRAALSTIEELESGQSLSSLPRGAELTVLKGELLSISERCSEALAAFGAALAKNLAPALHERALFGRGACRAQLGDEQGTARDLEAYLARFPEGRFAREAARALRLPRRSE